MKKALIALVLLLTLCIVSASAEDAEILGQPFPDFTVTDTQGNMFTLSEVLKDHEAVLINIWATWCPPCEAEMPMLNEVYAQYGDRVAFIALSYDADDTVKKVEAYREDHGITFPMGRDEGASLYQYLSRQGVPTTVIVDRFGNAVFLRVGSFFDAGEIRRVLEAFLGEGYTESTVLAEIPQDILGHAVDFAVMTLGLSPNVFGDAFAVSNVSKQFANGNPSYVAGTNGCELARKVLSETNISFHDTEDIMYLDKSPEYWAGWALAYYQWYSGRSFMEILTAVPLEAIIDLYNPFHEMDIRQFADLMDQKLRMASPQTRLKKRREICGLSQSELANEAGVPLRQIQLFEQRQRDINKTAASTLFRMSKSLRCKMEDLLEY